MKLVFVVFLAMALNAACDERPLCVDKESQSHCEEWQRTGKCADNIYVQTNCKKTCGNCDTNSPVEGRSVGSGCTPTKSLDTCQKCLTGDQCKEGLTCCPFMRKCVVNTSTQCEIPIAGCRPGCWDEMDPQSCTCNNVDFPENWAKATC